MSAGELWAITIVWPIVDIGGGILITFGLVKLVRWLRS